MKPTKFGLTRDRTSVCKSCYIKHAGTTVLGAQIWPQRQ